MDKITALLLWLLPISLSLHVVEEFFLPGGFIEWYHSYRPKFAKTKTSYYVVVNAILIAASFTIPISHKGSDIYHIFLVVCGWLSGNAIFTHIWGAIKTRRYSPGVAVGSVLILPLSIFSYVYFIKSGTVDLFSALVCAAVCPLLEILFATAKKPGMKNESVKI